VRALLWLLFERSDCAQPATVMATTTGLDIALASVLLVGVDSDSHCDGGTDRRGRFCGLFSIGRRCLRQPLLRWERQMWALV
jgi:hypothetical protein